MTSEQLDIEDETSVFKEKPLSAEDKALLAEQVPMMAEKLSRAKEEVNKVFKGQEDAVRFTFVTMIAGGHLLSRGVPGLGKTLLVNVLSEVMNITSGRIQFTPDLLPSDITGSEVLEEGADGKKNFRFIKGPIFNQLVLADEINRSPAKTQAALLQPMQEGEVTVNGKTYDLQKPFFVMATQNPIEQEGTYELPEAQLDRFLMRVDFDYPDEDAERWVLHNTTGVSGSLLDLFNQHNDGADLTQPQAKKGGGFNIDSVLEPNDLILMRAMAASMPIGKKVEDAIIHIVRGSRPTDELAPDVVKENVEWGAGPRAVQAFAKAARANALLDGRVAPNVQDVLDVVKPVMEHRMKLSYEAQSNGNNFNTIMDQIVAPIRPRP